MTTNRIRTGLAGIVLAVTTGAIVLLGGDLASTALLGVALGGAIALVPDGTLLGRTSGFVLGVIAAWGGYAFRAGVLPDIALGRAIAVMTVIAIVTAGSIAFAGWMPLWSGLLGAAGMAGAYEATFATSPISFVLDSTTAVTSMLLAVSLGVLLASALPVSRVVSDAPLVDLEPSPEVSVPAPRRAVDARVEQKVSR